MLIRLLTIGLMTTAGLAAKAQTNHPDSKQDILEAKFTIRTVNCEKDPNGLMSVRVGFHNYNDDKDYILAKNDAVEKWANVWEKKIPLTMSPEKYKLEDIQDTFIRVYVDPPTRNKLDLDCTLAIRFTDGEKTKVFNKTFTNVTITSDTAIRFVEVTDLSLKKKKQDKAQ
ncbi:hypothetical protein [Chitinophaga sp. CB10]|uniref:hypothetical protein n=1 Tax=Chitinophaga sp. CB10 TaxID=1891659 RepID=UPI0025C70775|nr:hypothetical protein [Chitinophaga sp. CB10]